MWSVNWRGRTQPTAIKILEKLHKTQIPDVVLIIKVLRAQQIVEGRDDGKQTTLSWNWTINKSFFWPLSPERVIKRSAELNLTEGTLGMAEIYPKHERNGQNCQMRHTIFGSIPKLRRSCNTGRNGFFFLFSKTVLSLVQIKIWEVISWI